MMRVPDKLRQKGKYWTHGVQLVGPGCARVSPGCDHCWALAARDRFDGGLNFTRFMPQRLKRLAVGGKPKVFSIWNDLFHPAVSADQIQSVYATMAPRPQHSYMVLTKRPERVAEVCASHEIPMPGHTWLGTTAEFQGYADQRIPLLLATKARKRFVSLEPLLGPLDLRLKRWVCTQCGDWTAGSILDDDNHCACDFYVEERVNNSLDWVIVGCETGPGRRACDLAWIESIVTQCQGANVPVWVKSVNVDGKVINDFDALPESVRVREMPTSRKGQHK